VRGGEPLDAVAAARPDYLEWMLTQPFFEDTKRVVRQALARARAMTRPALSNTFARGPG
jgi:hypothetical protein